MSMAAVTSGLCCRLGDAFTEPAVTLIASSPPEWLASCNFRVRGAELDGGAG
jgi:hypothetical protein